MYFPTAFAMIPRLPEWDTLGHMVEKKLASLYKVTGELPTMSRPIYETVHTGLPVHSHGIISNLGRATFLPNRIFSRQHAKRARPLLPLLITGFQSSITDPLTTGSKIVKLTTSLCQSSMEGFIPRMSTRTLNSSPQPGRLSAGSTLDYLLVHPMGMDHFGANSWSPIRQNIATMPFVRTSGWHLILQNGRSENTTY